MARTFVMLGDPADARSIIQAIRAFALAGRRGEWLVITGYGRHRRRLARWVTALRIDDAVVFADARADRASNLGHCGLAIVAPSLASSPAIIEEARRNGMAIIALQRGCPDPARRPVTYVGCGDVTRLANAMLTIAKTDPAPAA